MMSCRKDNPDLEATVEELLKVRRVIAEVALCVFPSTGAHLKHSHPIDSNLAAVHLENGVIDP